MANTTAATTSSSPTTSIPRDDAPLSKDSWIALFWLLVFSSAMFTLPFGAFFLVRHYAQEYFELDVFAVNCCSVLAAVMTVNLVIVAYAIKGFREVEKEKVPTTENDDDSVGPSATASTTLEPKKTK